MKRIMFMLLAINLSMTLLGQEKNAPTGTKMLYDFEGATPIKGLSFSSCKKKKIVDSKNLKSKALYVRFRRGSSSVSVSLPENFSDYDLILMDLHNASNFDWKFNIAIEGSAKYMQPVSITAGETVPVEIDIKAMKDETDIEGVKTFTLFMYKLPKDFKMEIDNIKLTMAQKKTAKEDPNVKILHSFERPSSRGKIAGNRVSKMTLSDKFATDGKQSLEVAFKEGNDSNITIPIPYDWSEYDVFAFDVNNPLPETVNPYLYFKDGFGKRFTPRIAISASTYETIEFPISALKEKGVDPEALKTFKIYFWGQTDPVTLQFDNFRLLKKVKNNADYLKETIEGWTVLAKKSKNTPPAPTEKQKAAGLIPFTDNYMVRFYPSTIPSTKQLETVLNVKMAKNEFEPFIIGLYSLENLEIENVEVSPLVNESGKKLTDINVRYAQPVIVPVGQKFSKTAITRFMDLVPFYQTGFNFDLPQNKTSLLWGTIHADKNQASGIYKGNVKIKAKGKEAIEYPLSVTIAPFVLKKSLKKNYTMLFTYEFMRMNYTAQSKWPELIEKGIKEVIDMSNHGMTGLSPHAGHHLKNKDGHPALPDVIESLRAAKKYGMTGPFIYYCGSQIYSEKNKLDRPIRKHKPEHLKRLADMVKYMQKICKAENLPEVYWLSVDEPNTPDRHALALKANKLVKSLGGKVAQTCHKGSARGGLTKNADIVIGDASPKSLKKYHKEGKKVWEYDNSVIFDFNEGRTRYYYGYLGWISGLDGVSSWTYPHHLSGFRLLPVAGAKRAPEYDVKGFPMDNIIWEMVREGIDDYRYLVMGLAKDKKELAPITKKLNSLPKYLKAYKFVDSKTGEMIYKNFLTIDEFKNFRLDMINILK